MRTTITVITTLLLAGCVTPTSLPPLSDPIPEKIQPGDIVVWVEDFVRVPKTEDSSSNFTNAAHARIQYIQPFGNTFGTLIINDTRGVLYLTNDQGVEPVVYMDLREEDVGFDDSMFPNEMGLAGVAFHPEFTSIGKPGFGKFYTAYSATSDSGIATYLEDDSASHESVIREWTAFNPRGRTFEGTSREIFRVGQFAPNHNIGTIAFNPLAEVGSEDYGVLYASLGDGGAANDPRDYGQNLAEPLSTIVRIKPMDSSGDRPYGIPADNPFLDQPGVAPEIWVYGLRHAQHFSWDSQGRMFISDIGQNQIEEVNLGRAGANYGWRLREGTFRTAFAIDGGEPGLVYPDAPDTSLTPPIAQYDHDEGHAISSAFVYEGNAIQALRGKLLFADLVNGRIFYTDAADFSGINELRLSFDGEEKTLAEVAGYANTYIEGQRVDLRLGQDALGELYLVTKGDGWIRKLVPAQN